MDVQALQRGGPGRLSLRDRKRMQWDQERREKEEWYPFGKPGAGAPLAKSRPINGSNNSRSFSTDGRSLDDLSLASNSPLMNIKVIF